MKTKCSLEKGPWNTVNLARQFSCSIKRENTNDTNSQRTKEDYPMKYNKNSKKETQSDQPDVDKKQYDHYY